MTVHVDISLPVPGERIAAWEEAELLARMWEKDPTVWFDPPRDETADRLGWLDLPTESVALIPQIRQLAAEAVADGITDLVLCGMGGSSLAPEVFADTLPTEAGHPKLTVIDTTHPDAVAAVHEATDPSTTWYLVSSKSGGTLETMSLFRSFWAAATDALDDPGAHFLAVTDPDSGLSELAAERGFRATVLANPDVGGRYSALSAFGLVPAGIIGADIEALLESGRAAAHACGPNAAAGSNPGVSLGIALGHAAKAGRVVARFGSEDPVGALPIWIEQLIAESTGKESVGIVPVDGGPLPDTLDSSVLVSIGAEPDEAADVRMRVDDPYDIGGAMFILEFATAVAGVELGIQPFDQPDVQLAKTLAHRAMSGDLPVAGTQPEPISDDFALPRARPLFVSLQAYVAPTADVAQALDDLRAVLTGRLDTFVTVGYGPRFLHSTGQLHKGGPSGGWFVQFVDRSRGDLPVPETDYTFGELIAAQAAGDRAALADRGRDLVAVDLGTDVVGSINRLVELIGGD